MVLALSTTGALELTAYATLVLAVVTGCLVFATFISVLVARRALGQTQTAIELSQAQLKQTQEEITISRQEVEQAQRPVVMPVADHRRIEPAGANMQPGPAMPRVYDPGKLLAPIENIGSGPALHVVANVKLLDPEGNPSLAPVAPPIPTQVAGLGTAVILPLRIAAHGWQVGVNFQLDIEYDDVAGKGWKTTSLFITDHYEGTTITECQRTRPLSGMVAPVPPADAQ